MKAAIASIALLVALCVAGSAQAYHHGRGPSFAFGFYAPPPVYVAPAPMYAAPVGPVVAAPAPMYAAPVPAYAPAPVYYYPRPVMQPGVSFYFGR